MNKELTCKSFDQESQNALYSALTLASNNYGCEGEMCEYDYIQMAPRASLVVELVEALKTLGYEIERNRMSEWISVKDRLPKTPKDVLVFTNMFEEMHGNSVFYCSKDGKWLDSITNAPSCFTPTHWQELPKPPEE